MANWRTKICCNALRQLVQQMEPQPHGLLWPTRPANLWHKSCWTVPAIPLSPPLQSSRSSTSSVAFNFTVITHTSTEGPLWPVRLSATNLSPTDLKLQQMSTLFSGSTLRITLDLVAMGDNRSIFRQWESSKCRCCIRVAVVTYICPYKVCQTGGHIT